MTSLSTLHERLPVPFAVVYALSQPWAAIVLVFSLTSHNSFCVSCSDEYKYCIWLFLGPTSAFTRKKEPFNPIVIMFVVICTFHFPTFHLLPLEHIECDLYFILAINYSIKFFLLHTNYMIYLPLLDSPAIVRSGWKRKIDIIQGSTPPDFDVPSSLGWKRWLWYLKIHCLFLCVQYTVPPLPI